MDKKLSGALGEKIVYNAYKDKCYKILGVNYHSRFGEIDIIAQRGNILVFCEVKTRQGKTLYTAKEAVTYSKQQKIKSSALIYLQENPKMQNYIVRFDVAEVYNPENNPTVNIIENAFE